MLALALLTLAYGPEPATELESRVREIFEESCTACHDASSDDVVLEGSLDHLRAPGSTGVPLVDPGNPEGSYLYQKMLGQEGIEGEAMPMGEDPLPAEQLAAVRDWIAALEAAPPAEPEPEPAGDGEDLAGMVAAIFQDNCASCHGDDSDHVRLVGDLSHLRNTTEGAFPLVDPGDPDHSYLYMKLVGADGIRGSQMPMGEDPLPAAMLEDVRAWIEQMPEAQATYVETGPEPLPTPTRRQRPAFGGTHQVALHTTTTLGKNALEFRVHHRFGEIGRPFKDRTFFGLASGAIMSLGVGYGIVDGLDVLLRWTNAGPEHELGVKYVPLRQENGAPVSVGAFASYEQIWSDPLKDCVQNENCISANAQVMVSRLWFDRWATQLMVGYSALTNHAGEVEIVENEGEPDQETLYFKDNRGTLDVGLASTVYLDKKKKYGLDVEYFLPIPALGSDPTTDPLYFNGLRSDAVGDRIGGWSIGFSARAGLHFFQVFATNVQNIHTGRVAVGGDSGVPFSKDGAHFMVGFNLSRKWNF
jgi:mono/diheme cytochrome c family protein